MEPMYPGRPIVGSHYAHKQPLASAESSLWRIGNRDIFLPLHQPRALLVFRVKLVRMVVDVLRFPPSLLSLCPGKPLFQRFLELDPERILLIS
jgi:hypothetical protein